MSAANDAITPDIVALKQTLCNELVRQTARSLTTPSSAMLFVGPDCEELPSALIDDPALLPIDKLIWLIMRVVAREGEETTFLPTMVELARIANVGSRFTVSKCLSILRCRRWLTVSQMSWRKNTVRRGSAYALYSKPLNVENTLYLDPGYVTFLKNATCHSNSRVRKVACEVYHEFN